MKKDSKSLAIQAATTALDQLTDETVIDAETMTILIDFAFAAMRRPEIERRGIEKSILDVIESLVGDSKNSEGY